MKNYVFIAAAAAGLLLTAPAQAGDAAAGEKVFKKCKACHYVDQEKNKSGPHLVNIVGRAAGAVDGCVRERERGREGEREREGAGTV